MNEVEIDSQNSSILKLSTSNPQKAFQEAKRILELSETNYYIKGKALALISPTDLLCNSSFYRMLIILYQFLNMLIKQFVAYLDDRIVEISELLFDRKEFTL
jgi:hypothetical protein